MNNICITGEIFHFSVLIMKNIRTLLKLGANFQVLCCYLRAESLCRERLWMRKPSAILLCNKMVNLDWKCKILYRWINNETPWQGSSWCICRKNMAHLFLSWIFPKLLYNLACKYRMSRICSLQSTLEK